MGAIRGRLIQGIGLLAGGAVMSILVAWAFAAVADPAAAPFAAISGTNDAESGYMELQLRRTWGATTLRIHQQPHVTRVGTLRSRQDATFPPGLIPAWTGLPRSTVGMAEVLRERGGAVRRSAVPIYLAGVQGRALLVDARGWPMRCVTVELPISEVTVLDEARGGVIVDTGAALPMRDDRARGYLRDYHALVPITLGFRLWWPGWIVNTLTYALVLGVLAFLPGITRRFVRRLRGVCPNCGYRIGKAVVCTECGTPLRRATAKPAPPTGD